MSTGCHLAIDAVGAKQGGAAVIVLQTLEAAAACAGVERVTIYSSPAPDRAFALPIAEWLDVQERPREEHGAAARLAWLTGGFAATAGRHGADVLLALNGGSGGVLPVTVLAQQAIPLSAEAMDRLSPGQRLRMLAIRAFLWDASRHADRIAVQLPWMREALVSQLGADAERVVVVGTTSRNSLSRGAPPRVVGAPDQGRRDAVLYVGNAGPHKNLRVLAPAIQKLRRVRPDVRLFATLPVAHERESDGVVCLGNLDDEALSAAYSTAAVLVFPSLVESAGLPLIEGMSLGVPIVVSDRPYAHDMCAEAALYFDPNDSTALADRLLEALDDVALRSRLRHQGLERAHAFHATRPYERLVELAVSVQGRAE